MMASKYVILVLSAFLICSCSENHQPASTESDVENAEYNPAYENHALDEIEKQFYKTTSVVRDISKNESISSSQKWVFLFPLRIISEEDKEILVEEEQFLSNPQKYISYDDMNLIASAEFRNLSPAGWRGHFLSAGKVWFDESDKDRSLRIYIFDNSLAWE